MHTSYSIPGLQYHSTHCLIHTGLVQVATQVCQVQVQAHRNDHCIPEIDRQSLYCMRSDETPDGYSQVEQKHRNHIHLQKGRLFLGHPLPHLSCAVIALTTSTIIQYIASTMIITCIFVQCQWITCNFKE